MKKDWIDILFEKILPVLMGILLIETVVFITFLIIKAVIGS